jgi:spoIIIJ-associated protein
MSSTGDDVTDVTDETPATGAEATDDPGTAPEFESDGGINNEAGSDTDNDETMSGTGTPDRLEVLENEGDIAADYLEELLDIADLDGDLDMDVEGDRASVSIVGADLSQLVGRNGEVLEALQELTRLAVLRETGERSRLMLDISGHRAERRVVLEGVARDAVAEVEQSGNPVSLKPMTPFERKVVHDVVAAAGLASDSEGVEPRRYVVVRPA